MARNRTPQTVPPVAAPKHYTPPSLRELRAEAVHRLQIGISGLAGMALLVGLANIIMERARDSEPPGAATVPGKASEASDPLADIGVAPASSPSASASAAR
jgi:hypothetical protein